MFPGNAKSLARAGELLRYCVVGAASVGLNLAIITSLTEYLGVHYLLSITICFFIVTLSGFFLNRSWTFRKEGTEYRRDILKYFIITTMQLGVSLAFTGFCVGVLHMNYVVSIVILSAIFAPITYFLHRVWSFNIRWT